jgi:hypothetical protein
MSQPLVPLKAGDILHLNELDYLYGTGSLHLRVTKVGAVHQLGGDTWVNVEGLTLALDGKPLGWQTRHAMVRTAALRHGVQRSREWSVASAARSALGNEQHRQSRRLMRAAGPCGGK